MSQDQGQVIDLDIFQKLHLYKMTQPQLDKEIDSDHRDRNRIKLGVLKDDEAEEQEKHLVRAVMQRQKIPTKRSIKEEGYTVTGYQPGMDYYVHCINEQKQNIFYDLIEEDFTFCERTEVTLDQLEFSLTALDLMFPYKYKNLGFSNVETLKQIFQALTQIHAQPE